MAIPSAFVTFSDYQAFLDLSGAAGKVNQVVSAGILSNVHLHFAWVRSPFPQLDHSDQV